MMLTYDAQFQEVVSRLHQEATQQHPGGWGLGLGLRRRLRRRRAAPPSMIQIAEQGRDDYLSITAAQGELLYLLLRMSRAQHVVEFGTSFGVSALYLARAIRDNGGGTLITTEIIPSKAARAADNIRAAGLEPWVDLRVGDAQQTLQTLPARVDALFLDGHKPLYPEIFSAIQPRLSPGGIVVADNIFNFSDLLRPYMQMLSETGLFWTVRLPLGGGMAISVRVTEPTQNQTAVC